MNFFVLFVIENQTISKHPSERFNFCKIKRENNTRYGCIGLRLTVTLKEVRIVLSRSNLTEQTAFLVSTTISRVAGTRMISNRIVRYGTIFLWFYQTSRFRLRKCHENLLDEKTIFVNYNDNKSCCVTSDGCASVKRKEKMRTRVVYRIFTNKMHVDAIASFVRVLRPLDSVD